jgi:diguanylate cyclase (GGDEF)-like protein
MQAQQHFSILLVDDDPLVIRVLSRILSEFEPVRFATTGRMALRLAAESVPDLVLLDVDMPEVSGFDVCRALKHNTALSQVPVLFISSHESPELEAKGLELGAADFISKPLHAALVLARVRTYQRMKALSDTVRSGVTMDFLTGAVTRRKLEKGLAQEWLRSARSKQPLALLVAEIEDFAAYNAVHGEEAGDACLRAVAEALRGTLRRPTDVMGRYAGGSFAVLLPETDQEGARALAGRAVAAVDALHIAGTAAGDGACVTLVIGGACRSFRPVEPLPAEPAREASTEQLAGMVPDDLIAAAEEALKSARSSGGHQVRLFELTETGVARTGSAAT